MSQTTETLNVLPINFVGHAVEFVLKFGPATCNVVRTAKHGYVIACIVTDDGSAWSNPETPIQLAINFGICDLLHRRDAEIVAALNEVGAKIGGGL